MDEDKLKKKIKQKIETLKKDGKHSFFIPTVVEYELPTWHAAASEMRIHVNRKTEDTIERLLKNIADDLLHQGYTLKVRPYFYKVNF